MLAGSSLMETQANRYIHIMHGFTLKQTKFSVEMSSGRALLQHVTGARALAEQFEDQVSLMPKLGQSHQIQPPRPAGAGLPSLGRRGVVWGVGVGVGVIRLIVMP